MPRTTVLRFLIGLACFTLAPVMAKEVMPGPAGQIYSHGTIRLANHSFEAVVIVSAELLPNIHAGQQVWMDVRQGQLRGIVKAVHDAVEVTIALDRSRSKVKISRLQPGQAVIAIIQLDPECDCAMLPENLP